MYLCLAILDGAWYGWQWLAGSVLTPSTVQNHGRTAVVPGAFPYVLYQHVCDMLGRRSWVLSHEVCCSVEAIIEECNGGKLFFGSYIGIAQ